MALKGPIPVRFEQVFPAGAFVVSEVTPVMEFANGQATVQRTHPVSGEPLWEVAVMDADESVRAANKTVKVKIASRFQPTLPPVLAGTPFRPVEFADLAVTPYLVETPAGRDGRTRSRIAYSITAREMLAVDYSTTGAAAVEAA